MAKRTRQNDGSDQESVRRSSNSNAPRRSTADPRGHTLVELYNGTYKLRLGFSELADADEHLGRSLIGAITKDPMNFNLIRVAFYFGMRRANKSLRLRSIREAGEMLEGTPLESLAEAISDALIAGGVLPDEDDDTGDATEEIREPEGEA